jgi:hypothetical protein
MTRSRRNADGSWPEPPEITRMRAELDANPEWKLVLFRYEEDRDPDDEAELNRFIERLIRERYNNGIDHVDLL